MTIIPQKPHLHFREFERITATVLPENIASWKIMEKCGMKYFGDIVDAESSL